MPRHPPSTPPTSRLNAFDPLTLTDGRLDSFEGVVGERENRGLEKSLSGAVRRQEEGIRGVWDLRTSSNFVSHNLRYIVINLIIIKGIVHNFFIFGQDSYFG